MFVLEPGAFFVFKEKGIFEPTPFSPLHVFAQTALNAEDSASVIQKLLSDGHLHQEEGGELRLDVELEAALRVIGDPLFMVRVVRGNPAQIPRSTLTASDAVMGVSILSDAKSEVVLTPSLPLKEVAVGIISVIMGRGKPARPLLATHSFDLLGADAFFMRLVSIAAQKTALSAQSLFAIVEELGADLTLADAKEALGELSADGWLVRDGELWALAEDKKRQWEAITGEAFVDIVMMRSSTDGFVNSTTRFHSGENGVWLLTPFVAEHDADLPECSSDTALLLNLLGLSYTPQSGSEVGKFVNAQLGVLPSTDKSKSAMGVKVGGRR